MAKINGMFGYQRVMVELHKDPEATIVDLAMRAQVSPKTVENVKATLQPETKRRRRKKVQPEPIAKPSDDRMAEFFMGVTVGITLSSVAGFFAWSML